LPQTASEKEMIENARRIAFLFYDLNVDSNVDANDLFTLLRELKNERTLVSSAYNDINDMQAWLTSL
jgi:Ca2+-binding EF-hand superfamily protein